MRKFLYYYQLERYETGRFLNRVFRNYFKNINNKKPRWDNKAKFMIILSLVLFVLISAALIYFTPYYVAASILFFLWIFRFLFLILSNLVYLPFEKRVMNKNFEAARQKVASLNELKTIGIAGSSGKSSIKLILDQLLTKNTSKTPETETTLKSLTETIQNKLNKDHDIFLCEMNSYKNSEIAKMCQLVMPHIGVLPAINEQHLDRFKTIEKTVNQKFELLQNLKASGMGIVNLDVDLINNNLKKALPTKLIGYTTTGRQNDLCHNIVCAENIHLSRKGAEFTVNINEQSHTFRSPLLGRNHVGNLLAAMICAVELGESPENLVHKVLELDQLPGRLEYKTYNKLHILDDTKSGNVAGFKDALSVLGLFEGKKVVATPGIVGTGQKSNEIHKFLGFLVSQTADLILLLGKSNRTDNIIHGALDNKFNNNNIVRLRDLREVYRYADKNLDGGDVVLLESSLPERYL